MAAGHVISGGRAGAEQFGVDVEERVETGSTCQHLPYNKSRDVICSSTGAMITSLMTATSSGYLTKTI